MEHPIAPAESNPTPLCTNCRLLPATNEGPVALCGDCRQQFIRYPIPKWLYAFSAVVLVLMVIGIFKMPGYLTAGIHARRAVKAIKKHNYITAQREATAALTRLPDYTEGNAYLLIAAAYNLDNKAAALAYGRLQSKQSDDKELTTDVNNAMDFIGANIPDDTALAPRIEGVINTATVPAIMQYYATLDSSGLTEKDKHLAGILIVSHLLDLKAYSACDTVLEGLLAEKRSYAALNLGAALMRLTGNYPKALAYIGEMLDINHEDTRALAQRSKTELMQKHDEAAARDAAQALALNGDDESALEAAALVAYYKGNTAESNRLLASIRRQELANDANGDSTVSSRLRRYLSGQESFR